ncbi:hypothetical protein Poly21_11680 [Allorhodopirellula heiligendammensis]|uniref:Uncharacterized protein n=1 Tax=Allorhodopirellula heiligendammensis TaxID=2714739 RepID=A0A5C6C4S9_9BACT|nr:hypothetical protein Poly21_11680 [Allorhodopirellula heiligendammensis]
MFTHFSYALRHHNRPMVACEIVTEGFCDVAHMPTQFKTMQTCIVVFRFMKRCTEQVWRGERRPLLFAQFYRAAFTDFTCRVRHAFGQ